MVMKLKTKYIYVWLYWRGGLQRSPTFWQLGPAYWKSNKNTSSSRLDNIISKYGFIAKLMSKGKKTFPTIFPSNLSGISELGVEVSTNVSSTEAGWEECKEAAMLEGIVLDMQISMWRGR